MASIHVIVDDRLKARLAAQAAKERRTEKAVVIHAVERYCDEKERRERKAKGAAA